MSGVCLFLGGWVGIGIISGSGSWVAVSVLGFWGCRVGRVSLRLEGGFAFGLVMGLVKSGCGCWGRSLPVGDGVGMMALSS